MTVNFLTVDDLDEWKKFIQRGEQHYTQMENLLVLFGRDVQAYREHLNNALKEVNTLAGQIRKLNTRITQLENPHTPK